MTLLDTSTVVSPGTFALGMVPFKVQPDDFDTARKIAETIQRFK